MSKMQAFTHLFDTDLFNDENFEMYSIFYSNGERQKNK